MKYLLYTSLLFIMACGNKNNNEAEKLSDVPSSNLVKLTDAQFKNADIASEIPGTGTGAQYISVKGQIEAPPQNRISITSPLGGYVKQIKLHIGDKVRKGETVAVLEDLQFIQLQQDYLSGKTRLVQLESEYERQEALSKMQASSIKQAELSKADFENQKILVKAISEKLRLIGLEPESLTAENMRSSIPIKSPVDGFVTAININMGKYVSGAEVLMELVDPSDIHLSLRVFEKDLPFLRIGQKVTTYTNNNPGKKYETEIVLIGKSILADKSVEVHAHFHSIPPELIPGLYMNADIEAEGISSVAVPQDAVIAENGKHFVFVDEGKNTFLLTPVDVQWNQNDSTGISMEENAPANKKVVIKNAYALYMQLRNQGE
jgi:cobalt-zinc-cadmium efflux system membrane fusion protein